MALFLTICSLNKAVGGQRTYDAGRTIGASLEPGLTNRLLGLREAVRQCVTGDAALTWQGVRLADLEFNRHLKRGPDFGGSAKAAYLPALNRYDGRFFHALGPDGRQRLGASKHHTLLVSGLYGLLRPTEPIQLYSCPLRHQVATMWASDGVLTDVLCQYIARHKISKVFDLTAVDAYRRLIDWDRVAATGTDVLHCFDAMGAGDYALMSFGRLLGSDLLGRSEDELLALKTRTTLGSIHFSEHPAPSPGLPEEETLLSSLHEAEMLQPVRHEDLPEYLRGGNPISPEATHEESGKDWRFKPTTPFLRDWRRLPLDAFDRIHKGLEELRQDPLTPRSDRVQPLKGNRPGWRYRLDPYRILYQPEKNQRNIILLRVEHRKDVYM